MQEELEEELGRKVDRLSRRAVEKSRNACRRCSILRQPVTLCVR